MRKSILAHRSTFIQTILDSADSGVRQAIANAHRLLNLSGTPRPNAPGSASRSFLNNAVPFGQSAGSLAVKKRVVKDGISVLENDALTTLIAMLFANKEFSAAPFRQLLSHLCAHSKTRVFLVHGIVQVLLEAGASLFMTQNPE